MNHYGHSEPYFNLIVINFILNNFRDIFSQTFVCALLIKIKMFKFLSLCIPICLVNIIKNKLMYIGVTMMKDRLINKHEWSLPSCTVPLTELYGLPFKFNDFLLGEYPRNLPSTFHEHWFMTFEVSWFYTDLYVNTGENITTPASSLKEII